MPIVHLIVVIVMLEVIKLYGELKNLIVWAMSIYWIHILLKKALFALFVFRFSIMRGTHIFWTTINDYSINDKGMYF